MGEKILNGTYNSGYTLSSSFSELYVTASGAVHGTNASGYAAGGDGVLVGFAAEVINHGSLTGGSGGHGRPAGGMSEGGSGYGGGAGANLTAGGTLANYTSMVGGAGGQGGSAFGGGLGGAGGFGARMGAAGTVTNAGVIVGGQGGLGGSGTFGGSGGTGGAGIGLAGGSVNNSGIVLAGNGGGATVNPHNPGHGGVGGAAVQSSASASIANSGLLQGGVGGATAATAYAYGLYGVVGGEGVSLAAGGVVNNSGAIDGGAGGVGGGGGGAYYMGGEIYYNGGQGGTGGAGCALASGGTVINTGTISGGAGGAGGQGGKAGYPGAQGAYGDGVYLAKGGLVTNGGTKATSAEITGLYGVRGGAGGAVTVNNFGLIAGYGVRLDGGGVIANGAKTSTSATIDGVTLSGAGTLTNFGSIGGFGSVAEGADRVVNFGYMGGLSGWSIEFTTATGRLVAETGSRFGRAALGGGGVLELAGGGDTITGLGGLGTITGGVSLECTGFGTYQFDPTSTVTLVGANTLAGGKKIIDTGAFNLAAGASLGIGSGDLVEIKGAVVNAGSIALVGATGVTQLRILAPGGTLGGGGTITLDGAGNRLVGQTAATVLTNLDNTISGVGIIGHNAMTLVNEAAGVIDAVGAGSLQVATKGETLVNGGLMEASGAGLLVIATTTVNNVGGTILAATGARVELENDDILGGAVGAAGTGIVEINVAGGEFNGAGHTVSLSGQLRVLNATNLVLNGAIANAGRLLLLATTSTADVIIGASGATLSGKGMVSLSNAAGNRIYGEALSDTLTNVDNLIEGAGQLGNGLMKLVNEAGGEILGNQTIGLTVNTVSNTITNAGLIENSGAGGTLVESAVVNTGTLLAAGIGTLAVTGLVTGAGVGLISGGTLDVTQAFSENVTFTGKSGVFELGRSVSYKGKVTGLSATGTNSLDLSDITFTSGVTKATYSGTTTSGTLTVTDGTHTAKIALIGDYVGHEFNVASDGHGGTTVLDPPAGAPAASLSQAMASFSSAPPPASIATVHAPPVLSMLGAPT